MIKIKWRHSSLLVYGLILALFMGAVLAIAAMKLFGTVARVHIRMAK